MKAELLRYSVSPSVVMADKESEITIKSFDKNFQFHDDITYEVKVVPQDISDVPMDDEITLLGYEKARKTFYIKPCGGELKIKYFFSDEQEWCIRISCKEYEKYQNPMYEHYNGYWNSKIDKPKRGIDLFVYSLTKDLYERRALLGDLHVHTTASDGDDSAQEVCAAYRASGRDFIAVTDHHAFDTARSAREKLSFMNNFTILCGEEVHNCYVGSFHMVNIESSYSVNDIYLSEPERVEREAASLENEVEVPEGLDKREYLHRVWLYREIKKSGGFAIFPHPCWSIGFMNTSSRMSEAIMKNGLCDAFEVIGGTGSVARNNMQLAIYNDLRAQGCDIPVVGSTDSHSVANDEYLKASTLVFAKNNDIIGAVQDGYSVAVETVPGESARVYGKRRLVFFAHFLLQNYYPVHNELCAVSGAYISALAKGDEGAVDMIKNNEKRIEAFEKRFFGK